MRAEPFSWSEAKQQQLQEQLTGFWVEDIWVFTLEKKLKGEIKIQKRYMRIEILSSSLRIEVKYALRQLITTVWKDPGSIGKPCTLIRPLVAWLNEVAPTTRSLLVRNLWQWEHLLRSYLLKTAQYRPNTFKNLSRTQEFVEYRGEDACICLFRKIYHILSDTYDDRPEKEKDIWDLRKLDVQMNPTLQNHLLNFTQIIQPWLRQVAKQFLSYRLSLFSAGDCMLKLQTIRSLSAFLREYSRVRQASHIDRNCIIAYISYLQEQKVSEARRRQLLYTLRVFFEVCAFQLKIKGFTREQIILNEDMPKAKRLLPRDIPEEVLEQLRQHLDELPTTILRMVVILLECGMRISELCALPFNCLKVDDKHEWYLHLYQFKTKQELAIPLVKIEVVEAIQVQQEDTKARYGPNCQYLFPAPRVTGRPYQQRTFTDHLNKWARRSGIKDAVENRYHFQSHQFRHTVGMRLLNEDVPLEVIRRLLGHKSLSMTAVYARIRDVKVREELRRVALKRRTIDYQGQVVLGDPEANAPEAQMARKGMRGQTLPLGGCGRPVVRGVCAHENKCLTCEYWLTSTEELPALKAFFERAIRLRQYAVERGNQIVVGNQDRIIQELRLRIARLEKAGEENVKLTVDELLKQLKADLVEMEAGLDEAREAQLVIGIRQFERRISELKGQIASLEGAL